MFSVVKYFVAFVFVFIPTLECLASDTDTAVYKKITKEYQKAYQELQALLEKPLPQAFKKAVFITENTFANNTLDYKAYDDKISILCMFVISWAQANPVKNYRFSDSINFQKNYAIYRLMKDSLPIAVPNSKDKYTTRPFLYNFMDYDGSKDWSNTFVTKMLYTYKGNCRSLPYLYKIIADQLDAKCWLSLAPNHIYIKNRCKSFGWYNTELTSGSFPVDAWIMASGYLPLKSIQNGIYMDTVSNQQSVAMCVLDLAKGYERQAKNYEDGFILKCCDLTLQYFPKNVQAMLLKAETLKHIYESHQSGKKGQAKATYEAMEKLYIDLFDLGYREMPDKMYMDWLQSVNKEKEKYQNKQVSKSIGSKK